MRVGHDRNHEAPVGLSRETQVDRGAQHYLVALDPGVELGIAVQSEDGVPGKHRQQADLGRGLVRIQGRAEPDQFGGVNVNPDRRLRDLPP